MTGGPPIRDLEAPRALINLYRVLWSLNNLLLIPVFSIIVVDSLSHGFEIPIHHISSLEMFNLLISTLFFSEWVFGLTMAKDRRQYLRSPARIADLVSSIPLGYFLQSMRFTRIMRVVRLLRVAWRIHRFRGHLSEILRVAGLVGATAISGAVALHMLEPETVPSFGDAIWWSVVTMSTVGYGDISPATSVGRAVATTMILLGIAIFGYALSVVTALVVMPEEEEEDMRAILRRIEAKLEALERR